MIIKKPIKHGRVSTYSIGCRCESCQQAAREYRREYRLKRQQRLLDETKRG